MFTMEMSSQILMPSPDANSPIISEKENNSGTITIEELVDLGDRALGLKVIVNSPKHSTHGIVSYILPDCQRLALEKASNSVTGKIRPGLVIYLFFEILSITIVGEDKETRKSLLKLVRNEAQGGRRVLVRKLARPHLVDCDTLDEEILLGKAAPPVVNNNALKEPLPPPSTGIDRPKVRVFIDKIDDDFHAAVVALKKEKVVGLSAKGRDIGRKGAVAWLNFATPTTMYFFDVAQLSLNDVLSNGLAEVLTDTAILKVIHDSRFLEDHLFHISKLVPKNIFDSQAASVYLHMLNQPGTVPSFLTGLHSLLVKYIGLKHHHLYYSHIREECAEDDEMIWFERPLPERLGDELAQSVMFLGELRAALLSLVLVDLNQVTEVFRASLRDKDSIAFDVVSS